MKFFAPTGSRVFQVAIVFIAIATVSVVANAAPSERDLGALEKASYLYIATVRKDGNQSKAARVWFILTENNQILIDTDTSSWKAKRIRRGSPVIVWIDSATGPAFIGKAEFVSDSTVHDYMIYQIPRKYWLAWMGFGPKRSKFDSGQIVTIRITPERDLPDGFASRPGTPAPALNDKTSSSVNQ
jgi:hypothetical protein